MSDEVTINEIEAQKINLQPGDVLMVTINHADLEQEGMMRLRDQFKRVFPNNEIMVFGMGGEGYVKFTVATQPKVGYCSNCDCGKKEEAELNEALEKASINAVRTAMENMEKEQK